MWIKAETQKDWQSENNGREIKVKLVNTGCESIQEDSTFFIYMFADHSNRLDNKLALVSNYISLNACIIIYRHFHPIICLTFFQWRHALRCPVPSGLCLLSTAVSRVPPQLESRYIFDVWEHKFWVKISICSLRNSAHFSFKGKFQFSCCSLSVKKIQKIGLICISKNIYIYITPDQWP